MYALWSIMPETGTDWACGIAGRVGIMSLERAKVFDGDLRAGRADTGRAAPALLPYTCEADDIGRFSCGRRLDRDGDGDMERPRTDIGPGIDL